MNNDFVTYSKKQLDEWAQKKLKPLFIYTNSEKKIEHIIGDFNEYGFELKVGDSISENLPFIDALLPIQDDELLLDYIQTPNHQYASIQIKSYLNGHVIFITNTTKHAHEIQEIQQNRNELCLAMNKIKDLLYELNY